MKVITSRSNFDKVTQAFQRRVRVLIYKQAEKNRELARDSMKTAPKGESSAPGTAPRSHLKTDKAGNVRKTKNGNNFKTFKDFIVYSKEKTPDEYAKAFIGPSSRKWAEEIGHTHEFGGTVRKKVKMTFRRKKGAARKRNAKGKFVKSKRPAKTVREFNVTRKYPARPFMRASTNASAMSRARPASSPASSLARLSRRSARASAVSRSAATFEKNSHTAAPSRNVRPSGGTMAGHILMRPGVAPPLSAMATFSPVPGKSRRTRP